MAIFKGTVTVTNSNNEEELVEIEMEIDETISQTIEIDYISIHESGGPIMRPKNPR